MASKITLMHLKTNMMRNAPLPFQKSVQDAKEKESIILKRQIDDMKSRDRWLKESKKKKELCFKKNRKSDEEIAMEWLKSMKGTTNYNKSTK